MLSLNIINIIIIICCIGLAGMVIQVAFTIPESTREYEVRSIACAKAGGYMLQGGCFTGLERIYFIDETIKIKVSNGDIFEIND